MSICPAWEGSCGTRLGLLAQPAVPLARVCQGRTLPHSTQNQVTSSLSLFLASFVLYLSLSLGPGVHRPPSLGCHACLMYTHVHAWCMCTLCVRMGGSVRARTQLWIWVGDSIDLQVQCSKSLTENRSRSDSFTSFACVQKHLRSPNHAQPIHGIQARCSLTHALLHILCMPHPCHLQGLQCSSIWMCRAWRRCSLWSLSTLMSKPQLPAGSGRSGLDTEPCPQKKQPSSLVCGCLAPKMRLCSMECQLPRAPGMDLAAAVAASAAAAAAPSFAMLLMLWLHQELWMWRWMSGDTMI